MWKKGWRALGTFRERLPSKQESTRVLAFCAFVVYSWSILWFFWQVPSWRLFLSTWEIASILAYVLAFALLESVAVFILLTFLSVILPLCRNRFVPKGSALLIVNAFWAFVLHAILLGGAALFWSPVQYALCALLYLASTGVALALVHRSNPIANALTSFTERVSVLLYIYVPFSILSLFVVIIRQLTV